MKKQFRITYNGWRYRVEIFNDSLGWRAFYDEGNGNSCMQFCFKWSARLYLRRITRRMARESAAWLPVSAGAISIGEAEL